MEWLCVVLSNNLHISTFTRALLHQEVMSEFTPQIMTNVLRRAWLGALAQAEAHLLSVWDYSLAEWRLKRPRSISSAEGVRQHHARPSVRHIAGILCEREPKKTDFGSEVPVCSQQKYEFIRSEWTKMEKREKKRRPPLFRLS